MPKNLTDVDTFTSPIVVPVGTDPRTAASVELAAQGLANRTRNLLDQGSLQRSYDRSEVLADVPHIDVGAGDLVIGGTTSPSTLTVGDGLVEVEGNLTFDVADFDVTNGTTGSHALVHVSGAGAQLRLESGAWSITPPFGVAGTNADSGDIGDNRAEYIRVGDRVAFSLAFVLDSTGYTSSSYVFRFNPPVTSNFGSVLDVQGTASCTYSTVANVSADIANNLINVTFTLSSPGSSLTVRAHGQFRVI